MTASSSVDDFAALAREFREWARQPRAPREGDVVKALRLLSRLVAAAHDLAPAPIDGELEPDEEPNREWLAVFERFRALPVGAYTTVLDPRDVEGHPVGVGDLADDLADIDRDLLRGLSLYDAGRPAAAGAMWRFDFAVHWGQHAVNALRVLHGYAVSRGLLS